MLIHWGCRMIGCRNGKDILGGLSRADIQLKDRKDTLVWVGNQMDGNVSAKLMYEHIAEMSYGLQVSWWEHCIWSWNICGKLTCFF